MRRIAYVFVATCLCVAIGVNARAQYFGQNKVRHKVLHFEVMKTQHFDIYYYPDEKLASEQVGRMAERWYARFTVLFHHVLTTRQPIVLYASHTDFEQTTVLPGMIGESTGGVTLANGRKVVLPLAGSLAATDHVLGHELVHAYQYDMTTTRGSPVPLAAHMPLWFIEGMAEYCSIGPEDANTAMWMRDAVARDQFPTIKDLNNPNKYFPYRYGEAFWAFVGGKYGDDKIAPMLLAAAGAGGNVDAAIQSVLHVTPKQLSAEWRQAAVAKNQPILQATQPVAPSAVLIAAKKNQAGINVSPAVSPDGKWVMFFSERGLFSIDLYLANAQSGHVIRRITSTATSAHFNSLLFINSAGAWSADSRQFAFGHVEGGKATVSIYNLARNQIVKRYVIPGAGEIFSPTWSPDGKQIAFSAIEGGLTNLYVLNLDNGAVRKLTDDAYAELEPAWSPDGNNIALVTDRFTTDLNDLAHGQYRLALMNMTTGAIQPVAAAGGGNQTNPQWSADGRTLYYLSDVSGIPSIYRLALNGGSPEQLTNLQSGVSGITALSPAFSLAANTGEIIYSDFSDNNYSLVRLAARTAPIQSSTAAMNPALLAPRTSDSGEVADYLHNWQNGLALASTFTEHPYHPALHLDYIAPPSVAVGVGSYGTMVGGGTALYFSDLLGYRNLMVAIESLSGTGGAGFLNGLSGSAVYTDDHHRWTWGVGGGQTPFASGSYAVTAGVINGRPVAQTQEITLWEMNRNAVGILSYPFSRAQRIEFTGGYENIGYAVKENTQLVDLASGAVLGTQEQNLPGPPALNFAIGTAALVYDTSIFGGVSPIRGQSYRFQAGGNAGSVDFETLLADYRRYIGLTQSFSLAGRLMTFGRYGSGANDPHLQELFVGDPTLVRGYDFNSFTPQECGPSFATSGNCPILNRLVGNKIGVVNLEARLELLGPLGVYSNAHIPPVELAPFFDAGSAWTSSSKPNFFGGSRQPVSSEGLTLRVNALGFAVVSISYALPNNRPLTPHVWEFTFQPGF